MVEPREVVFIAPGGLGADPVMGVRYAGEPFGSVWECSHQRESCVRGAELVIRVAKEDRRVAGLLDDDVIWPRASGNRTRMRN